MAVRSKPSASKDGKKVDNFRMRRLSVSDNVEPPEKDTTSSPVPQGRRQRRMSMSPEMGVIKPRALLPFTPEYVGTYSCHGVEPGMKVGETNAKINQDRGCICYPFGPEHLVPEGVELALFCVYDGHGACGDKVSHYVMNNIQSQLEDDPLLIENPEAALKRVFVNVDNNLKADPTIDAELSGTTAIVVLVRMDKCASGDKMVIYAACAGDSRCVLAGKKKGGGYAAKDLSEDQKPDTPDEQKRITKAGGYVSPPEIEWGGPARVWLDKSQTLPGLAMARSIGDHLVASIGVIAEPVITCTEVNLKADGDIFMVLASDGVWEFIESQTAVNHLADWKADEKMSTNACTKLIECAAAKWRQEEGDYRDDITAIVVYIPDLFTHGKGVTST